MNTCRILIAEPQAMFREGLCSVLRTQRDFVVVGLAADGRQALDLAMRYEPQVLVLNVALPVVSTAEVLRELDELLPSVRSVVLADRIDTDEVVYTLKLGCRGAVQKDSPTQVLFKGIRAITAGRYWLGQEAVSDLRPYLLESRPRLAIGGTDGSGDGKTNGNGNGNGSGKGKYGLTRREQDIVRAVLSGWTNKQTALRYEISEVTVKHHLTSIYEKLRVPNRLELALFALQHSLVEERNGAETRQLSLLAAAS